jgi:hypothetical protein
MKKQNTDQNEVRFCKSHYKQLLCQYQRDTESAVLFPESNSINSKATSLPAVIFEKEKITGLVSLISKRARARWFLVYTMLRNPVVSVTFYSSKSNPIIKQGIYSFANTESGKNC